MPITQRLTVAQLRPAANGDDIEVMFLESARIYLVRPNNSARDRLVAVLQDAMSSRRPISVTFSPTVRGEIATAEPS